ncbi:hypothetical protein PPYR_05058 [Photinus pyralis]|uniref:Carboxylic ester hydrolase n=1 Tax=Photinus pyralis TaxID=7054 RepID=A0A5N4AZU8_PHOPY|nr:carboxylesterase 4A-like isoform X1 [Photinus pyralis]KAB0802872.1 hypothetical protein PPYR_05058 [Photinus pyralis]
MKSTALLVIFVAIFVFETTKCKTYQPKVRIGNYTTIIGRVKRTVDAHKKYDAFYAIPYARPPVGDLRFRAPLTLTETEMQIVIDSSTDPCPCLQQTRFEGGCEDCLYLNVYRPHLRGNSELLPVMVWIYGGAFVRGSNSYKFYGPDFLLNENVIVVTINYRLGVFGFLGTEDASAPGNYGIKDQLLALQWVNKNIVSFGGNPGRVTLFGESAGAASVSYLSQLAVTKGLFQGAIMESGSSLCSWSFVKRPLETAKSLAKLLGVDTNKTATMVDSLRQINHKALQDAQSFLIKKSILFDNLLDELTFSPCVEPASSDALITRGSYSLLNEGKYHEIPYMMGYNSLEVSGLLIAAAVGPISLYFGKFNLEPEKMVPLSLNIDEPDVKERVVQIIRDYYFNNERFITSKNQLRKFLSDGAFVRPITKSAQLYSLHANVYFYVFSYAGLLGSGYRQDVGHTEELPYLWNSLGKSIPIHKQDQKMRVRMARLWTNFAKFGNPTPFNDSLLDNVVWPTVDAQGTFQYLNISRILSVSKNPNWDSFTFWKNLFTEFQNPPYNTY